MKAIGWRWRCACGATFRGRQVGEVSAAVDEHRRQHAEEVGLLGQPLGLPAGYVPVWRRHRKRRG